MFRSIRKFHPLSVNKLLFGDISLNFTDNENLFEAVQRADFNVATYIFICQWFRFVFADIHLCTNIYVFHSFNFLIFTIITYF